MKSLETLTQWIEKTLSLQGLAVVSDHFMIELPGANLHVSNHVPNTAHVLVCVYDPIILEPNCTEEIELKSEPILEKSASEHSLDKETEFVGEYILSLVRRKKDFLRIMAALKQMEIFNSDGKFQKKYRNTKLISGVIQLLFDQDYLLETDNKGNQISLVTLMHAFQDQFTINSLQPIYRNPIGCAEYADIKVPIIGILQREKLRNNQIFHKTNP